MRGPLPWLIGLLGAAALVFALWPEIDLTVARAFYGSGGFIGGGLAGFLLRGFFRVTPFVALAAFAGAWLARRCGYALRWAPSGRGVIFLIATMAIGPGLIVNLGLKDHAHRPRPVQTEAFGGPFAFRPWYRFDGGCAKNCSFVSGEASTGFWMVAPASLAPPQWRAAAVAGALAFGALASLLRMAYGGHYLSDVVLAALLTLLVVEAARRVVWRGRPPD